MINTKLVIPKVWRSELKKIALFIIFSLLSAVLSVKFPISVIEGEIFPIGDKDLYFSLPILWFFMPFLVLLYAIYSIYNVKYAIDNNGVEARVGVLSLNLKASKIRYEDIRNVNIRQTILERFLDIGDVEISTAATGSIELILSGVAAPDEIQDMLQRERESRQKNFNANKASYVQD